MKRLVKAIYMATILTLLTSALYFALFCLDLYPRTIFTDITTMILSIVVVILLFLACRL
jgi:hypothetical protein